MLPSSGGKSQSYIMYLCPLVFISIATAGARETDALAIVGRLTGVSDEYVDCR